MKCPFTDPVTPGTSSLTLAHAHLLHPISHPGFPTASALGACYGPVDHTHTGARPETQVKS